MHQLTEDFFYIITKLEGLYKIDKEISIYFTNVMHLIQLDYYKRLFGIVRSIQDNVKDLKSQRDLYEQYIYLLVTSFQISMVSSDISGLAIKDLSAKIKMWYKKNPKNRLSMLKGLTEFIPKLYAEPIV